MVNKVHDSNVNISLYKFPNSNKVGSLYKTIVKYIIENNNIPFSAISIFYDSWRCLDSSKDKWNNDFYKVYFKKDCFLYDGTDKHPLQVEIYLNNNKLNPSSYSTLAFFCEIMESICFIADCSHDISQSFDPNLVCKKGVLSCHDVHVLSRRYLDLYAVYEKDKDIPVFKMGFENIMLICLTQDITSIVNELLNINNAGFLRADSYKYIYYYMLQLVSVVNSLNECFPLYYAKQNTDLNHLLKNNAFLVKDFGSYKKFITFLRRKNVKYRTSTFLFTLFYTWKTSQYFCICSVKRCVAFFARWKFNKQMNVKNENSDDNK